MFSRFTKKQQVLVNGTGKCNGTKYSNNVGTVICRDPYFLDYNIQFEDNSDDWLEDCLKIYKGG